MATENDKSVPLPEDNVDWSQRFQGRCHFMPGRDCPGCKKTCARLGHALPTEETHDMKYDDKIQFDSEPEHDLNMPHKINALGELVACPPNCPAVQAKRHFRSCPACRGSGKLDIRCAVCAGRGSIDTDSGGNPSARVEAMTRLFGEAAEVAVMPTDKFTALRRQIGDEAIEWALRWLTMRAKNMGATQDYIGEHRLNQAVELMRNAWKEENAE